VRRVVEEWSGLDVMVNNAGVGVAATASETSEEDYDLVMDVCVRGTLLGMKYAILVISESGGGLVINMSSIAALVGLNDRVVYSAAKGAMQSTRTPFAMWSIAAARVIARIAPFAAL
jgi:NAD(P)-dependent dehydrogenase (short-subunit alcohol dehydrogenase family)